MMSTRGEDLDRDRTRALERLAPRRAIETRNIEAFWDRFDPGAAPPSLMAEAEELWDGKAVLVLPDGSRWVHVKALLRGDAGGGNRYIQRLRQLLLAHMALSEHVGTGGGVGDFSLAAASLDLRHVFCHECTRCVDLEHDAAQVDVADGHDPR